MGRATLSVKAPEATRRKILEAAFAELYANGFQGGSLNHIVETADTTKGALFHHFDSKQRAGLRRAGRHHRPVAADALAGSAGQLQRSDHRYPGCPSALCRGGHRHGMWLQGCPLNNLAQETSPLDEGFYVRINGLYATWRERYAAALERGRQAGAVEGSVAPANVAALIAAAQMGIWGTGKSSRSKDVMRQAAGRTVRVPRVAATLREFLRLPTYRLVGI